MTLTVNVEDKSIANEIMEFLNNTKSKISKNFDIITTWEY